MDKILPYTPIVWTMISLSSGKAGSESSADSQSGVWMVVALLAIIAGYILFVTAKWLVGSVCNLYERIRHARKSRTKTGGSSSLDTEPLGPRWTIVGSGITLVSRGLLKDISNTVPTTETKPREAAS